MTVSKTNPYLNSTLKKTENGGKILVLETNAESPNIHADMVVENFERAIPGTKTKRKNSMTNTGSVKIKGSSVKDWIIEDVVGYYNIYAKKFKEIAKEKNSINVVSISEAMSESLILKNTLKKSEEFFAIATQEEKKNLWSSEESETPMLNLFAIESYIDESLDAGKPKIDQAKKELEIEVAKLKKEKNIAVLAGVANEEEFINMLESKTPILFEKNEGENFLTSVEGVIGAGTSESNGKLTKYSSRGQHTMFTAVVAYADQGDSGTSFSPVASKVAELINEGMPVAKAIKTLENQGTKITNEEGDTYTFLPPKLFSGKEKYDTGIPKQDRPSTQLKNKQKGDTLNSGQHERA
jgi:hypothetical protein